MSDAVEKVVGFGCPWRRCRVPGPKRRIFYRDIEEEHDFENASARCMTSYYSVFVVRLAIMVMLAILIGLLTILTWHFTKIYTRKSLDTLASGLRCELLQRPILRMWNILNSTSEVTNTQVKLSEYVIRKYSKPYSTLAEQVELYEVMRDLTWGLFASRKALNAITIQYKNGFVQAFHRDHHSNNTFYIYSDVANYSISNNQNSDVRMWTDQSIPSNVSATWYREPLDPLTGEKIGKSQPIPPDDVINVAGLSQVPDGTASWHVAVSKHSDSPLLSAALPVWDASNGSIVAVVGVTTAFYSVGQLMRELVEVHSGYIIYLTSQEGYLLATSTNAPLLRNSTSGPKLMMAVNSEDYTIQIGARWLRKVYGNKFPPGNSVHVENAKLGGQQYYIDSFFLNLKRLPIVGVIIIPREYIMGSVDQRAFKTLDVLICAALCILFIGCICILILTNGVSKEMKLRAELISHLDARRKAEASNNYKSQFLANMSHELRTPMAAVIGLLDILISDDCLTKEQYATVTQIRKCSTALLGLLNNILDLSKVESGKLVLEDAEFDLGRELEGLIDMFSVQCLNHNVEAILDLSDDMPKLVRGDSARVVQIFANLINNSIKFTTSGHIILRGWSENMSTFENCITLSPDRKKTRCTLKTKLKQHRNHMNNTNKKDGKIALWFEIDDTGCGIDPSKWETVFESFEQADPSTTRLHGGTGLGLCIVRNLVNKMGGEIEVVKKNGPGTLMRLSLVLSTTNIDGTEADQQGQLDFSGHNIVVLLALHGTTGRVIMSHWLQRIGLLTVGLSEWNEVAQVLGELFFARTRNNGLESFDVRHSLNGRVRQELQQVQDVRDPVFVIVVDIGLLDTSTNIWKEQLNFLDRFFVNVKFAWMLNHHTSNALKMELGAKGHTMMMSKPLYKAKMVEILETVTKEKKASQDRKRSRHQIFEIDSTQFKNASSEASDTAETGSSNDLLRDDSCCTEKGGASPSKAVNGQKSLHGLRILLAEDTPVLQAVAATMLRKMGATVTVVGDGLQAVNALNTNSFSEIQDSSHYDLILMDCQMPKMDGYEATRAIRKLESGTGLHVPIVALTAHAMSSDEATCLEVGMDAYLAKPIDYKLMLSTILSLTAQKAAS